MTTWRCRACGYQEEGNAREKPWAGPCPQCGRSCNAIRASNDSIKKANSTFASVAESKVEYVPTNVEGIDIVLGGGLVGGSPILFGGFRGAGKTTLWVTALDKLARRRKGYYASSEQSTEAVIQYAHRVGATSDNVIVRGGQRYIEDTLEHVRSERPFLVVYDSLQKYVSRLSSGTPGSASQGTAVASAIKNDCRKSGRCAVIVNQMARSGELKGGSDVEHDVDTVMVLAYPKDEDEEAPGLEEDGVRMLIVDKNRNGPENLKSYWRMTDEGRLEHVPPRSKLIAFPGRGKYGKKSDD